MNWEKLCPNLNFNVVENKMGNSHKKGWSHFETYVGKNIFHWGKWNESNGNSAYTTKCLTKSP